MYFDLILYMDNDNNECYKIKKVYNDCLVKNGYDEQLLNTKAKYLLNSKIQIEKFDRKVSLQCGEVNYMKCLSKKYNFDFNEEEKLQKYKTDYENILKKANQNTSNLPTNAKI